MEMDKTVMIQVKCKGMKKSEMHIVSYSDGTEVNKDVDGDIYIMMQCLCVTKNEHFLLGVSCNHLNYP